MQFRNLQYNYYTMYYVKSYVCLKRFGLLETIVNENIIYFTYNYFYIYIMYIVYT